MVNYVFKKSYLEQNKSCHGFTIAELVVVVAVIGIVSAILIPSIILWRPNVILSTNAKDVYSLMQNARMVAVKNNTAVSVVFNQRPAPNASSCFIDIDGSGTINQPEEQEVILSDNGVDFFANPGLRNWNNDLIGGFTTFPGAPPSVTFNSNGVLAGVNGTIYISYNPAKGGVNQITHAITAQTSGTLTMRSHSGIVPFSVNDWD